MALRAGVRHLAPVCALTLTFIGGVSTGSEAQTEDQPGRVRRWPCVLVVHSPLLEVLEGAWDRSPTFRRQCEALAETRAVTVFRWGTGDSDSRARTHMRRQDGVIVATIVVPTGFDTVELVAHELQHVLERARGLDYQGEANRPGSGVWRAAGAQETYETQAAIDAGRQVARELRDTPLSDPRRPPRLGRAALAAGDHKAAAEASAQ
jgi:hypothetical protein